MGRSLSIRARLAWLALSLPLGACAALAPEPSPARVVRGPIATRVEHPLALSFLGFRPRRPFTQAPGSLGFALESAYASHYQAGLNARGHVITDGETWHNALRARYGIDERTDLELELGLLVAWAGFLDGFAEGWHDLFGLPNGGREDRPEDAYAMSVVADGREAWSLDEERLGLLDVPLVLTRVLLEDRERGDALAARVGVELPLGAERHGFGNGHLDFGGGLVAERTRGRWSLFAAADAVAPGKLDSFEAAGLSIDPLLDAQLGVECRWTDRLSLLAGLVWLSPLTNDLGLEEIESSFLDLGLGFACDTGERSRLRVSFHEDLATGTGADFVLALGWSLGL